MPRLLGRLVIGPAVVLILVLAVVGWGGARVLEDSIASNSRTHLTAVANALAEAATATLASEVAADWVGSSAARIGLRVALIGANGQLVADSGKGTGLSTKEGARTEILGAKSAASGFELRAPAPGDARWAHLAVRLPASGALRGYLRITDVNDPVDGKLGRFRHMVAVAALAGVLALVVIGWRVGRRIEVPLRRIHLAVSAMASGDFASRLDAEDVAPFGALATALESVARVGENRTAAGASDRHKVATVLAAMVEGVLAVDLQQRIMHMNAAAARILGVPAVRIEERRVPEVTRIPEVGDILTAVLSDGCEHRRELRVVVPPRDRWVELHATPLSAADGRVAGALLVLHDVTELRRLESMRRDFVANVSHELKTPIAAIRGIVETILDDAEMQPETRIRFLGRARDQSLRLSALVTDLLTLSRVESGDAGRDRQPIDLCAVARDAVLQLEPTAEACGVDLELAVPGERVQVMGDADSLRLVVTNLLDNAIKYSATGGRVTVRLRIVGDSAEIEVEDGGVGIERKHLDRIFQRFYRIDKARSRELGGTGLGLSIVKHVVLNHGGDVAVDSSPGRGSTFRVRLPMA